MKYFASTLFALLVSASLSTQAQVGTKVAALDDSAWAASEWISMADAPIVRGRFNDGQRAADGSIWFVSTISNEKPVTRALWMTTSLGVNEIYVNEERVGKEVLRPGFTSCFKTKRSYTYDITKAFRRKAGAENTLSAQVTPGWWADDIVTPGGSNGTYGTRCAFRGVLQLTYADGTTQLLGTDTEHWTAGLGGPVTHAAIFDGEDYDARIPLAYESGMQFRPAEINTEFKGEILPSEGAEIYHRYDLALKPTDAYVWKDVTGATADAHGTVTKLRTYPKGRGITLHQGETLVIDFGQNCAAVPEFTFQAAQGTLLTCLPGELLNDGNGAKSRGMDGPEGSVHRFNLRTHETQMRLTYTFAGSRGAETFVPRSTFFGYRYLSITATGDVQIKTVRSIPVSSITQDMEIGSISTGNALINQLISNTQWGQRSNYLSIPTDCPQRNERLGWTADTQVFCETGSFFANTDRFFHKWLRDLRDTQSQYGGYPGVAPHGQYACWEGEMMRVGWADAGIIVPWTMWKQYGDTDLVREGWASMEKYMDHLAATKYDHTALKAENGNYQWADWLSYEPLESCGGGAFGPDGPLPEAVEYWNYLCASYWLIDAQMMLDMARAIGADVAKYEAMTAEARQYIRSQFFTPEGTFKTQILNTMQTPALFALKNKILEGEARQQLIKRLRQNFRDHDNCLQTGFLGTSILMSTLTENGMVDIAYNLLFQRRNPSWLYSVDNGATTIWERWNSYTLESGMGPAGMNSFNHYAYGCVCQWIWQTAAGINADPAQPGFRHIILRPVPDYRLGHLDATYRSASGIIKSSWRYRNSQWTWNFTIPQGCTATVIAPGQQPKEYQAGSYSIKLNLSEPAH